MSAIRRAGSLLSHAARPGTAALRRRCWASSMAGLPTVPPPASVPVFARAGGVYPTPRCMAVSTTRLFSSTKSGDEEENDKAAGEGETGAGGQEGDIPAAGAAEAQEAGDAAGASADSGADAGDSVVEELKSEIKALEQEVEDVRKELKEAKEQALYVVAEMENVRSIARRDADQARQYAVQSFAKQLLDVADNLDWAIDSVPAELRGEGDNPGGAAAPSTEELSAGLTSLVEGVEMTSGQLAKVFEGQGLAKFGVVGDAFDPHLHDAMFEYEDDTKEAGTLGQVLKPGYRLHDRIIRAAQVGTIKDS